MVKSHLTRGAVTLCLAAAATATLTAQWYQSYDQGVAAVKQSDWKAAEEKLDKAKKDAAAAKQKPGRRVFRYGNLWAPFLPDYYLVQVYAGLASKATDEATRKDYIDRAIKASNEAKDTGQVRQSDAEFEPMSRVVAKLSEDLGKIGDVAKITPGPPAGEPPAAGSPVSPVTPPPVDPLQAPRRDVQDLLARGERALAAQTWDEATAAFQQASARIDATPALKPEFPQVSARAAEAALGLDISTGLRQLASGAFAAAADTLERAVRAASSVTASSQAVRSLLADAPKRLAEARLGQTLTLADTARQQRQWASAISAYESAQRGANDVQPTSARVKQLQAELPARLQEARLQLSLVEKRFGDALKIDPKNAAALAGQYEVAFNASRSADWETALAAFTVLLDAAPAYRDAAERRLVAEIQVEYRLGLGADATNPTEALVHYRRIGPLQQRIRGPLSDSPDVVAPSEKALSRVRRITSDANFVTAEQFYQDGKWDDARASANLVIDVFPDDKAAADFLRRLDNRGLRQQIDDLTRRSTESLQRGDLSGAMTAATQLAALVPDNKTAKTTLDSVVALQAARSRRYRWILASMGLVSVGPLLLVSSRRRARFLAFIGQPAPALKLYERVLSHAPTDGETLTRATQLAATHRLQSGLEPYLSAYLLSRPEDDRVAMLAADHFWRTEAQSKAIDVYVRALAVGRVRLPAVVYERLLAFHASGIPAVTLQSVERARQRDPDNADLIRLLAHEYARHGRSDSEALSAYRTAAATPTASRTLLLAYAKALLTQGDVSAAAAQAARASLLDPDDEAPLDLLHDVYLRMRAASRDDVSSHLERLTLPSLAVLVVGERLCREAPDLRPSISALYGRLAAATLDTEVSRLVRLHRHLDLLELDSSRVLLDEAVAASHGSRLKLRALIQAHVRHAGMMAEQGQPPDTQLLARTAQLYTEGGYWSDAVNTWQQLVAVPEWNRRSMSAIQDVIDRLPVAEMTQIYFATAGWQVDLGNAQESPALIEYRVTPGAALSKELAEPFNETQVFCYVSVVTVDDLIEVKRRMLAARGTAGDAVAFLAASQAIRHDVYALIYAFMTEEPSLTVIPIEAQAIRDALVEARSRAHLERTLHQWLGHTDIYETHNPVANAATFFGRGQFINQLVLKISRGENFGIFGLRKIGKTSLVYRLRELSRDHLVAYVDLQGVASRRVGEVYARLLQSLVRDLRVKHPDVPVPPLTTNAADPNVASAFHTDVIGIRAAFEALNRQLPHVLLLLDEIELMIPEGQSPGFEGHQEFFRHVRGLYQQERFIVSAVVGATPGVCRTAKWNGRDNPVFQFYDEVFLAPLDRSECDQMVQGLGELMGVRFDVESLAMIFEMTAGHPYVARQLCSRLVKSFVDRPLDVHAAMVDAAAAEYLAQRGDYFAGILEGYLDPVACRMVEAIAAADEAGVTRADLFQQINAAGAGRAARDQTLGDLEVTGLAVHTGDRYRLRIPLFRRWLRRSWLGLE